MHRSHLLGRLATAELVGAVPAAVHLAVAAVVLLDEGEAALQSLAHLGADAALAELIGQAARRLHVQIVAAQLLRMRMRMRM